MSSSDHTGVSVDLNAETGASVNAPVLTGNTITGPVTFNYSLNPAGNGILGETFDCQDLICNWMSEPPGYRLEHNII